MLINIKSIPACERTIRLTAIQANTVKIAENIINGKVLVFPKLPEIKLSNNQKLWDFEFTKSVKTYQIYTHAFYPISYLCNAYDVTGDIRFLHKAKDLIIEWIEYSSILTKGIDKQLHPLMWGDHATSNRSQVIIYFIWKSLQAGLSVVETDFKRIISIHAEYLNDDNNYRNYNHGLMMDLSLLLFGIVLDEEFKDKANWKSKALSRIKNAITRDFASDGVHIENSPGYHLWMLGFLNKVSLMISRDSSDVANEIKSIQQLATRYVDSMTREDNSIPMIGDTLYGVKQKYKSISETVYFNASNIAIIRQSNIWAYFKSGYFTHVHKHQDDLSFNLNIAGVDVLFDPGFYNYEGSQFSQQFKSATAHNTLTLNDTGYQIYNRDLMSDEQSTYQEKLKLIAGIDTAIISEHYDHFSGFNKAYQDSDIRRDVVFVKRGYFILIDQAYSDKDNNISFEQIFNLSPSVSMNAVKKGVYDIIIDDKNYCRLESLLNFDEYKEYCGDEGSARGYHSIGFGQKAIHKQIVHKQCNSPSIFLTLISINKTDQEVKDFKRNISIHDGRITINIFDRYISVKTSYKIEDLGEAIIDDTYFESIILGMRRGVYIQDNSIVLKTDGNYGYEYAYYIYSENGVFKKFYTDHEFASFDIEVTEGKYRAVFFYKRKRVKKYLVYDFYINESMELIIDYDKYKIGSV
ncbi:heparinase II/III family protein [Francisella philomiragia]|uniref:heparinase II/III domain-containing protein n=1 Tax=Francisella philomiragia TaxID=28110 RepID=UPI0035192CF6